MTEKSADPITCNTRKRPRKLVKDEVERNEIIGLGIASEVCRNRMQHGAMK